MSGLPRTLPDPLSRPRKRRLRPLRVIAVTLASLVTLAILVAAYLWIEYSTNTQAAEDSRTEGLVVVWSQSDLHDISDPLPAGVSEEDYALFWAEPALNTPDSLALLELFNEGWKVRLEQDMEYIYSRADRIGDEAKRANARAAADELADFLSHGTVQAAKRVVYEDLARLSRETCHRGDVDGVMYRADGSPLRTWSTTHAEVLSLLGTPEYKNRATTLVGKVYPGAFEAALPHICIFPRPPESTHEGDMELMESVTHEADMLLNDLRVHPNSEGQLGEDDYEAFWNSPVMTSPEVQSYLDRVGVKVVNDHRARAAYLQGDIDQIKDPAVREHAQQYLTWAVDEAARDNGRRLAVGKVYEDLEGYWTDTCLNEPDRWLRASSIKRNVWTSRLEPDFSPQYVTSARSFRDTEWGEATFDLALQFYPEAYEAGLGYFCT